MGVEQRGDSQSTPLFRPHTHAPDTQACLQLQKTTKQALSGRLSACKYKAAAAMQPSVRCAMQCELASAHWHKCFHAISTPLSHVPLTLHPESIHVIHACKHRLKYGHSYSHNDD